MLHLVFYQTLSLFKNRPRGHSDSSAGRSTHEQTPGGAPVLAGGSPAAFTPLQWSLLLFSLCAWGGLCVCVRGCVREGLCLCVCVHRKGAGVVGKE